MAGFKRTLLVPPENESGAWLEFFPEQPSSSAQRILRALLDPAECAIHYTAGHPLQVRNEFGIRGGSLDQKRDSVGFHFEIERVACAHGARAGDRSQRGNDEVNVVGSAYSPESRAP